MKKLLYSIIAPASLANMQVALCFMRVGIGILTILHGVPKMMGGMPMWNELGKFMLPLGISFTPVVWGFLGACTEFFGGMALTIGFGTRIASAALSFMMFVATVWHINRGDIFNIYSFPLSLIIVYLGFFFMGGGEISIDNYLTKKY